MLSSSAHWAIGLVSLALAGVIALVIRGVVRNRAKQEAFASPAETVVLPDLSDDESAAMAYLERERKRQTRSRTASAFGRFDFSHDENVQRVYEEFNRSENKLPPR